MNYKIVIIKVVLLLGITFRAQSVLALQQDTEFFKRGQPITVDQFINEIRDYRAVLVGETHDRLDHHLHQLQIIYEIHKQYPDLVIGLEYFQTPFQDKLDAFVKGRINTKEMLRETEYYLRWRYDHRLIEPIFNFARDNNIPLLALNVPAEITSKIGMHGIDSLDPNERAHLPVEIDRTDQAYKHRLQSIFEQHYTETSEAKFENFYDVQLLWDEGMASVAANYLAEHPKKKMVILAGMGHIEYGAGIPKRLQRRLHDSVATVLPATADVDDKIADYVFKSRESALPRRGLLGLLLELEPGNQVRSVKDQGAASQAGVKAGDIITAIDGDPISDLTDIKVSLSHKRPGDIIALQVSRAPEQTMTLNVELR